MPEKAILRIVVAAMILLPALPTFLGTGSELYDHLAAGGSAAAVPSKIAGTLLCGALVLVASLLVARAVRAIQIARRGEDTSGVVVQAQPQRDGAWQVAYEYRDRGGETRRGVFHSDRNIWREGDKGSVRYDLEAPGRSTWTGPDPDRAPGPPAAASNMRQTLARFRGVVFGLAAVLSACAVYGFWVAIWRDGGARVYEAWQSAAILAGLFVVFLPFAAVGGLGVLMAALLAWGCFAVVRRVLRD